LKNARHVKLRRDINVLIMKPAVLLPDGGNENNKVLQESGSQGIRSVPGGNNVSLKLFFGIPSIHLYIYPPAQSLRVTW
jgi:hypothetical protein